MKLDLIITINLTYILLQVYVDISPISYKTTKLQPLVTPFQPPSET